jgi:uncharacterized protein with GYD domain
MPKFLFQASYTTEGLEGIRSAGGSARREAITQMAESVGGRLESFHFAFGNRDAYVICELPDNQSAAAVTLAANASGAVSVETVALLTPEEIDEAANRSVDYSPPGS